MNRPKLRYCGKCHRTNQRHSYRTCPTWEACLYCGKKGHFTTMCRKPHSLCDGTCIVPWYHPFRDVWCPRVPIFNHNTARVMRLRLNDEQSIDDDVDTRLPWDDDIDPHGRDLFDFDEQYYEACD